MELRLPEPISKVSLGKYRVHLLQEKVQQEVAKLYRIKRNLKTTSKLESLQEEYLRLMEMRRLLIEKLY